MMCRLHDEGRDHIGGYDVRNLARPMWLAREANRVDVLVGNPPWLAYRHMTADMQAAFRRMSQVRGLWAGAEQATHQDLAGLFAVQACQLYLRSGGKFGLVMPNTTIDREHYRGFRSGRYGDATVGLAIAFSEPWDLRRIRPHFFPRASSVVFGTRADGHPVPMPEEAQNLDRSAAHEQCVLERAGTSHPHPCARPIAPRRSADTLTLCTGLYPGRDLLAASGVCRRRAEQLPHSACPPVASQFALRVVSMTRVNRGSKLSDFAGVVETEFVRPFYTGENVFPYRVGENGFDCRAMQCTRHNAQSSDRAVARVQPMVGACRRGLGSNIGPAIAYRSSNRLTTSQSSHKQFPVPSLRIVYNRAGMHVVAAKITNRRALIANGLYWASVRTDAEANYLCAILNAPVTTELVRPFMSYGKDERDIHKAPWELPVPTFDEGNATHIRLPRLGAAAEQIAATFTINPKILSQRPADTSGSSWRQRRKVKRLTTSFTS